MSATNAYKKQTHASVLNRCHWPSIVWTHSESGLFVTPKIDLVKFSHLNCFSFSLVLVDKIQLFWSTNNTVDLVSSWYRPASPSLVLVFGLKLVCTIFSVCIYYFLWSFSQLFLFFSKKLFSKNQNVLSNELNSSCHTIEFYFNFLSFFFFLNYWSVVVQFLFLFAFTVSVFLW